MSKHTNKHWLREKEFISLNQELDHLYDTSPRTRFRRVIPSTRMAEINGKLEHKFFNEYRGKYKTAPKWYRKMLNRSQRAKSKQTLYRDIKGYDVCYEDNYKGCSWYW